MIFFCRLIALLVLSIVLLSPVAETTQGIVAVLAVLTFVAGFAMGLGAGAFDLNLDNFESCNALVL